MGVLDPDISTDVKSSVYTAQVGLSTFSVLLNKQKVLFWGTQVDADIRDIIMNGKGEEGCLSNSKHMILLC